jgi:hypothetical protein
MRARKKGQHADETILDKERKSDKPNDPLALEPFAVVEKWIVFDIIHHLRHMVARDQTDFSRSDVDLLIVGVRVASAGSDLQFQRLFVGTGRPNFCESPVEMLHDRVSAAMENHLDRIAPRQRQTDVRPQGVLTTLSQTKRFGLLPLGDIAKDDDCADEVVAFDNGRAVVLDREE